MSLEKIQEYLSLNPEYAWLLVFAFAFGESMIITGAFLPSAILFSICIYLYNTDIMSIYIIASVAVIGAHLGDLAGFFLGKTIGPNIINMKFFQKRQKAINRVEKFLDRFGPYTVILGRFIPAIRPLTPFLLGITDLNSIKFYRADVIACLAWGIALILLVISVGSIFE